MGWPTKTNCDNTPRPTLGNPASLLPYVYRPAPMSAQALATYCNPPAPDPRPVAAPTAPPCYSDVVTLTDADDLADFLPSAPPTPVAGPQPTIDIPTNFADIVENDTIPSTYPRLSPEGTSLTEPDTLVSGGVVLPTTPPPTDSRLDLALGTQHVALASPTPCLSPEGTSLSEPDTSVSGGTVFT